MGPVIYSQPLDFKYSVYPCMVCYHHGARMYCCPCLHHFTNTFFLALYLCSTSAFYYFNNFFVTFLNLPYCIYLLLTLTYDLHFQKKRNNHKCNGYSYDEHLKSKRNNKKCCVHSLTRIAKNLIPGRLIINF